MYPLLLSLMLASTPSEYQWRRWPDYAEQVALVNSKGTQVGIWMTEEMKYYPRLASGKWGASCSPPISPPTEANYGVDREKLEGKPGYWRHGKQCSRQEAFEAIESSVPDDRGKLRLTVIGPKDQQTRVLQDLKSHPALSFFRDKVVVQAYAPDHWAVKGVGFVTSGSPTIYLQQPDGKVLHRQDRYDGAEELASALRKAHPDYQPDKDPPKQPNILPGGVDLSRIPTPVWALGGLSLLLLLSRRSQ